MKLISIEALAVRLPRELTQATGTAGSPTHLAAGAGRYLWSDAYPAVYSTAFETALVRIQASGGLTGWGEAQAPVAPEVACAVVNSLLGPLLEGAEFSASPKGIEELWQRMYSSMRVRGQTGGFMLDAISGIDLALWDLAGKEAGLPVSRLLAGNKARRRVPVYLSGLSGGTLEARLRFARDHHARAVKLYLGKSTREILETMDALREALGADTRVAVDALWHLKEEEAAEFGAELDRRNALWLECPYPPEDPEPHARLARSMRTPVALGESYRTCYEMAPFFRAGAVGVCQPDLGRTGLTEGMRLAAMARRHGATVTPHLSIALAPQVAAAIHFAAAVPDCEFAEFNPRVFEQANRFSDPPLENSGGAYLVPDRPGLGVEVRWDDLLQAMAASPASVVRHSGAN